MLTVYRPFDRSVLAEIPVDDAAALEKKLSTARAAFLDRDGWLAPHQRSAILLRAAVLLEAQVDRFAKQIAEEGGKPLVDARVETVRAVDGLRNAADALRTFSGKEIPMGLTAASTGRWAFTTKEPIGVVVALSAFNHPLNLIVHQVAPAVAVGSPVIVKPSHATPLSCLALVELLHEAGLDERWCQTFITEDTSLAERLATDARVAFLSFIGSAKVGWYLRSKLTPGARCALEHGGVAPVIIDRSADLDRVIDPLTKGGYYHAGQVCVSVQRIFVHADIKEKFIERFAARVGALVTGDPTSSKTEVGPLIHPREATRVREWIAEAGAKVIGGGAVSDTTLTPAIVIEPPANAKLSLQEVFGPVTCVYGYDALDEAIARANALPFAFQAAVFSQDINTALRAAQRLDASAVMVNDHTAFRTDWMPFAGRHQSGYGVGGIPYSMHDMSAEKMVVLRHG